MVSRIALLALLVAAIVASTDAIKCHSCDDCSSIGLFTSSTECTKVEYPKGAKDFFDDLGMKGFADGLKNLFNQATESLVRSCYKVVAKSGDNEIVYRGCSISAPSSEPNCHTSGSDSTCVYVCDGDGCNSAPALHLPGAIVMTCLLIVFTFIVA